MFRMPKMLFIAFAFGTTMATVFSPVYASTKTTHHQQNKDVSSHRPYVIQPGDTLWKIAQDFHTSVSQLENANPHVDATNLIPGHTLVIPTGHTTHYIAANKYKTASFTYRREISVTATSYTASQGTRDYSGNVLKFGTIAVDPKVIPLGSTVLVEGMSFPGFPSSFIAHATDEGTAIKGDKIDIYLPVSESAAMNFGLQHLKVFILK